jgi:hypothetical protein
MASLRQIRGRRREEVVHENDGARATFDEREGEHQREDPRATQQQRFSRALHGVSSGVAGTERYASFRTR